MIDTKLLREIEQVDPESAKRLARVLEAGEIVEHFAKRRDLPTLRAELKNNIHALLQQFIHDGMKVLGVDISELDYDTEHPGMDRNPHVRRLATEARKVLRKAKLPDEADFWQKPDEEEPADVD